MSAEWPESSDALQLSEDGVDGDVAGDPWEEWWGGVKEGFGLRDCSIGTAELIGL